jgi:hypothetical protein
MPGTEAFLTEDQLHQLFYNGMPGHWQNKFVNAGKVVSDLTIARHTRYFRQQEKLSLRKQHDNAQSQCRDMEKSSTPSGSPKFQ